MAPWLQQRHHMVATAQTVAPNVQDVSVRIQDILYLVSGEWEEVGPRRSSLFMVYDSFQS